MSRQVYKSVYAVETFIDQSLVSRSWSLWNLSIFHNGGCLFVLESMHSIIPLKDHNDAMRRPVESLIPHPERSCGIIGTEPWILTVVTLILMIRLERMP